ncbi:hypothetical protein EI534_24285 [Pseudomonas frederiksbergensis]|nr:hypothetical protein [Pseudomonas frederiksbergensis]
MRRKNPHTTQSMWERACSRRRRIIQHMYRLAILLRGQARSHRFRALNDRIKCSHNEKCPVSFDTRHFLESPA